MKKTQFEKDFFYYEAWLELLGGFRLSKQLTMNDLGNTAEDKAMIQKCYRDIKRDKFKGTVIDYLCSISADYILDIWVKKGDDKEFYAIAKQHFKNFKGFSKKKDFTELMPVYMVMFLLICHENKTHARNLVRLFNKNPRIIIENKLNRQFHLVIMDVVRITLNFFNLFMILSSYEFLRENLKDPKMENELWEHLLPISIETLIIRTDGWDDMNWPGTEPKKHIEYNLLI